MKTKHEKIFKREDGSRVKIVADLMNYRLFDFEYRTSVYTCKKNKRSWFGVVNTDSYEYRGLSMDDRRKAEKAAQLKIVSKDEILQVKIELWELLKPYEE